MLKKGEALLLHQFNDAMYLMAAYIYILVLVAALMLMLCVERMPM